MSEIRHLLESISSSRKGSMGSIGNVYTPQIDVKQVQRAHQELLEFETTEKLLKELNKRLILYSTEIEAANKVWELFEIGTMSFSKMTAEQKKAAIRYDEIKTNRIYGRPHKD